MKKIFIIVVLIIMSILSVWHIHNLSYPSPSFMKLNKTEYYTKDQALAEYMKERHKFKKDEGYDHASSFSKNNSVLKSYGYTDYKLWATYFIQNGRSLIHVVDSFIQILFLSEIYQQTFTLLNTKIKDYSENKISFTNILISIVALLIALISLIVSIRSDKKVN